MSRKQIRKLDLSTEELGAIRKRIRQTKDRKAVDRLRVILLKTGTYLASKETSPIYTVSRQLTPWLTCHHVERLADLDYPPYLGKSCRFALWGYFDPSVA